MGEENIEIKYSNFQMSFPLLGAIHIFICTLYNEMNDFKRT